MKDANGNIADKTNTTTTATATHSPAPVAAAPSAPPSLESTTTSVHFPVEPLDGKFISGKLKRRVQDTEFDTSVVVLFDTMSKGRISRTFVPKETGTKRNEERYLVIQMHFAPGQFRRLLAFSQYADVMEKAVLDGTKKDSTIDYFNVVGRAITKTNIKGRNIPNDIVDTGGMVVEGLVAVHKDGSKTEYLAIPGEALNG